MSKAHGSRGQQANDPRTRRAPECKATAAGPEQGLGGSCPSVLRAKD